MPDMRRLAPGAFDPYLARLREIPFVRAAKLQVRKALDHRGFDGLLVLRTTEGVHELPVELKRTYLTYAVVDRTLGQMRAAGQPWILFAPYIPRPLGRYLEERGVNYVDLAGNHRLVLDCRLAAHAEGRTEKRAAEAHRGLRVPGYQVLFAILAAPHLLNATVRQLAAAAGTGKTAAAETLRRFRNENLIGEARGQRFLLEPKILLDRWLAGYAMQVRPRLLLGTFHTKFLEPAALERHLEAKLGADVRWGFGGGAAARRIGGQYRGERTVVYLEDAALDLPTRLGAQRADDGTLVLIGMPGRVAYEGVEPRTVHPLLVYTELLAAGEPRAREAAAEIAQRHLEYLR